MALSGRGRAGGHAHAQLRADSDGAVLRSLRGAVHRDLPEVLPEGPPGCQRCHHRSEHLSVRESFRYQDHPDFQPGRAEAGRFCPPQR